MSERDKRLAPFRATLKAWQAHPFHDGKQRVDSSYLFKGSHGKQITAASPPLERASLAGFTLGTVLVMVSGIYSEMLKKQIVRLETVAD